MPQKWNLQDIRPASERRIQKVPPSKTGQVDIAPRMRRQEPERFDESDISNLEVVNGNTVKKTRIVVSVSIAFLIIISGFMMNLMLGGATVTIEPKTKSTTIQSEFVAYSAPTNDELSYELLVLSATAEKQVQASGKEKVTKQATGKIFIYNTKSTSPQRLITNTRFESPDGLIFRIKDSIEIPGATKDSTGALVPGKVSADVFADGTGEQYNIQPTRFSVPGLKNSEQYEHVYAESLSAFTGGFDGEKYIIADAELQKAQQELHIELRNSLLEQLNEKIPAGFILYNDAITFTYHSLPSTSYGDSLATIKEEAVLNVPLFKASEFARFITEKTVSDYKNEPVYIEEPHLLQFAYVDTTVERSDLQTEESIRFTLQGNARIIWEYDKDVLTASLLGIKKSETAQVFSSYTSIAHAESILRPFWAQTFPTEPKKIKMINVTE